MAIIPVISKDGSQTTNATISSSRIIPVITKSPATTSSATVKKTTITKTPTPTLTPKQNLIQEAKTAGIVTLAKEPKIGQTIQIAKSIKPKEIINEAKKIAIETAKDVGYALVSPIKDIPAGIKSKNDPKMKVLVEENKKLKKTEEALSKKELYNKKTKTYNKEVQKAWNELEKRKAENQRKQQELSAKYGGLTQEQTKRAEKGSEFAFTFTRAGGGGVDTSGINVGFILRSSKNNVTNAIVKVLPKGKVESQEVINAVLKTGNEATPEGKAIIKGAIDAQKQGKEIEIVSAKELGFVEDDVAKVMKNKNKATNQKITGQTREVTLKGEREAERLTDEAKLITAKKYNNLPEDTTPESTVKVYRVTTGDELKAGDYLSFNKANAEAKYLKNREGAKVIEQEVKVKDLVNSGGTKDEFIYAPEAYDTKIFSKYQIEPGKHKYNYVHNNEKAFVDSTDRFGQSKEPSGKYMNLQSPKMAESQKKYYAENGVKNMEQGTIEFKNPLIVKQGEKARDWKDALSKQYGGKTKKDLTRALIDDGYDGIITLEKNGEPSEVVSFDKLLKTKVTKPKPKEVVSERTIKTKSASIREEEISTVKNIKDVRSTLSKIRNEYDSLNAEAEAKAIVAQEKRTGINTKDVGLLKRIYARNKKFQEGDIETIRNSNSRDLVNRVVENVQEVYPQFTEREAFDFAMDLPTKADEGLLRGAELKVLRDKQKVLNKYLEDLKKKKESLKLEQSKDFDKEWTDALAQQEKLERTINVPRQQLPVASSEGAEKISRLEARVTESLSKTPQEIKDQLGSTYTQMNKKDQIAKASRYVNENPDEAMAVLRGEIDAPKDILKNSIYVAMENMAHRDTDLARKLASLQSTRAGQELSILTEINPNSPVKLMQEIVKIREEAFKARYKGRTAQEVKNKVVKDIQKNVKKPDKYDWSRFVDSIQC